MNMKKSESKYKKIVTKKCVSMKLQSKMYQFWREKNLHNYLNRVLLHYTCTSNEVSHKMRLIKIIRSMYLMLNRHRGILYSTHEKDFWISAKRKKYQYIENIDKLLNNDNYYDKKYLELTKITLLKYDDNYGRKIGEIMNKKFGKDISWVISTYI